MHRMWRLEASRVDDSTLSWPTIPLLPVAPHVRGGDSVDADEALPAPRRPVIASVIPTRRRPG